MARTNLAFTPGAQTTTKKYKRPPRHIAKVRASIKSRNVDDFLWSLIDYAFEQVQVDPENKSFHILLRDMSVLAAGKPSTPDTSTSIEQLTDWLNS